MFRPRPFPRAAGIIAVLTLIFSTGIGQAAPYLAVPTTSESGQIEIVDVAAGTIVARIDGLDEAHGLAVTPDGGRLVVASLVEREEEEAGEKPAGVSAEDHAAHHGGEEDAADEGSLGTAAILDLENGTFVRRVDVPGGVHHVAISPDGRYAALTHPGLGSVSVLDLETFAVTATVPVGEDPNYAVFAPGGAELLVSVAGADALVALETKTWQITTRVHVGASPEHLVLAGDGRLVVNLVGDEAIAVVDLGDLSVKAIHQIGGVLHGIAGTEDGTAAVVSLMDLDKLARIRLADGVTKFQDLGPAPYHVTSIPGSNKVFVSSAAGPGLTVIDQRDLSVLGQINTSGIGHQMAPLPNHLLDLGVTQ